MKRTIPWLAVVSGVLILGFTAWVEAQNPVCLPGCYFNWNQSAPSLTDAKAYIHRVYLDGSTTGIAFSGKDCTGTASPFQCVGLSPSMSNGTHTARLTAANGAGESPMSSPFVFDYGVVSPPVPSAPTGIFITNPQEMRPRPRHQLHLRPTRVMLRTRLLPQYWGPLGDLTFTASTDHANVVNYEARLYTDGTTTLIDSYNLGKPTPDGSNLITVHLYTWFNSHASGNYLAKVASIGSSGQPGSESSTGDSFVVPIVSSG